METAKIFKNGSSQAVRLPREFPEDFMNDGRNQPGMQKRESF